MGPYRINASIIWSFFDAAFLVAYAFALRTRHAWLSYLRNTRHAWFWWAFRLFVYDCWYFLLRARLDWILNSICDIAICLDARDLAILRPQICYMNDNNMNRNCSPVTTESTSACNMNGSIYAMLCSYPRTRYLYGRWLSTFQSTNLFGSFCMAATELPWIMNTWDCWLHHHVTWSTHVDWLRSVGFLCVSSDFWSMLKDTFLWALCLRKFVLAIISSRTKDVPLGVRF